MALYMKVQEFYKSHFEVMPREKTEFVTADSLVDMLDMLAKKAPAKWGKKETDLLIARYSMVHAIDGTNSSYEAVEKYSRFCYKNV